MTILINGVKIDAPEGISVAAALLLADQIAFRRSVSGEPRAPLCGMGICFECRVAIDGAPHRKSCQILVREGMEIRTA